MQKMKSKFVDLCNNSTNRKAAAFLEGKGRDKLKDRGIR